MQTRLKRAVRDETSSLLDVTPVVEGEVWKVDCRRVLQHAHPHWQKEILRVARAAEEKTIVGGKVKTSFAPPGFRTIYHPTNGLGIATQLPWLLKLYREDFCDLVAKLTGDPSVHLGNDLEHSLNINRTIRGPYELHPDRNKYTVLLGIRTVHPGQGGETILWKESVVNEKPDITKKPELLQNKDIVDKLARWEKLDNFDKLHVWKAFELWKNLKPQDKFAVVRPEAGIAYVFDGRTHLHEVTPFEPSSPDDDRVVIPGDYYTDKVLEERDVEFNKEIGVADAA